MRLIRTLVSLVAFPVFLFTFVGIGKHEGLVDGYRKWQESKAIYAQTIAELDRLRTEKERYARLVEALRTDPLEQEWLARRFGYIKPGERVYRILRPEPPLADKKHEVHFGSLAPSNGP